jgi:hypothetical protein
MVYSEIAGEFRDKRVWQSLTMMICVASFLPPWIVAKAQSASWLDDLESAWPGVGRSLRHAGAVAGRSGYGIALGANGEWELRLRDKCWTGFENALV